MGSLISSIWKALTGSGGGKLSMTDSNAAASSTKPPLLIYRTLELKRVVAKLPFADIESLLHEVPVAQNYFAPRSTMVEYYGDEYWKSSKCLGSHLLITGLDEKKDYSVVLTPTQSSILQRALDNYERKRLKGRSTERCHGQSSIAASDTDDGDGDLKSGPLSSTDPTTDRSSNDRESLEPKPLKPLVRPVTSSTLVHSDRNPLEFDLQWVAHKQGRRIYDVRVLYAMVRRLSYENAQIVFAWRPVDCFSADDQGVKGYCKTCERWSNTSCFISNHLAALPRESGDNPFSSNNKGGGFVTLDAQQVTTLEHMLAEQQGQQLQLGSSYWTFPLLLKQRNTHLFEISV